MLDLAAALAACVLLGGDCVPQFFVSLALHEAAHIAALRAFGTSRIRFTPAPLGFRLRFGAADLPRRARLAVSLAGCAANALLAAASLAFGVYPPESAALSSGALRFAAINVSLAAFNLLPIDGLDGAEAISAILSDRVEPRRAYVVCRALSLSFALALWLVSVFVQLRIAPAPEILLAASFLLIRELT